MFGVRQLLLLLASLAALTSYVSAEWRFDENGLKNCYCFQGCSRLCGWACGMDVGCWYNPAPSDASPACRDTKGGPCMCAGFGCGRCQMVTTGKGWQGCQEAYAKPVCGDGKCEGRKDENCQSCPGDCKCFSTAECSGKDPKDERGCTDKCAGMECKPKCEGSRLYTGGKCNRQAKRCDYKTFDCKNGCDNSSWGGAKCKPEDDKCKGVVCEGICDFSGMLKWDGRCNETSGQCYYLKNATCPKGCAGNDKCNGFVDGIIYYTDATRVPAGVKEPMRFIKVKMRYIDEKGTVHEGTGRDDPEYFVWTDDQGKFAWRYADNFHPEGKVSLALVFENKDKKLYVIPYNDRADRAKTLGVYYDKNVPVTDSKLRYYDVDLVKTPLAGNDALKDTGKIYANVLKAVEYKENDFRKGDTVEERVMLYEPNKGAWHLNEVYKDTETTTGMSIQALTSGFSNPEAPTNREFHEYGHHIMGEYQNAKIAIAGQDHGGYYTNPNSEYGLLEAWAEFCGLVMKRSYGMGSNGDYDVGNTIWNLEANYKIDSKAQPKTSEELALAGVLWDLVDSQGDLGGPDDDQISLWPVEVYNVMATKYDFGGGAKSILSARELYIALNATGNPRLREQFPGQDYTKLEQIFLIHNVYQDLNNNSRWDNGEPFGYSGHGNVSKREDLEYEPGTEVKFDVKDQSGKAIPNLYAKVEINYTAPYAHLSRIHLIPVQDGFVAVPMPPEDYNATIQMTAVQGGTENLGKDKFKITTKEIYQRITPKKPLGTLKTTIKTSPVKCKSDTECMHWLAGNKCSNKTGTCEGEAGLRKSDKIGCGNGLRCEGEKESPLGGITSSIPCCSWIGLLPLALVTAFARKVF